MSESRSGDTGQQPHRAAGRAQREAAGYGRRALMLGAAGAGAGIAAGLVGGGQAQAADGNPVLLGESNSATRATVVSSRHSDGLQGTTSADLQSGVSGSDSSSGGGFGVSASSKHGFGVSAVAPGGTGVYGGTGPAASPFGVGGSYGLYGEDTTKGGGHGVAGVSTNGTGVRGTTQANGQSGLSGDDTSTGGGHGVAGASTNGTGVRGTTQANGQSGIAGIDTSAGGGHGSYGRSSNGTGAYGSTAGDGQAGVRGVDASTGGGYGVQGSSTAGTGVWAQSSSGTALAVAGVAAFDRSGIATVPGAADSPQELGHRLAGHAHLGQPHPGHAADLPARRRCRRGRARPCGQILRDLPQPGSDQPGGGWLVHHRLGARPRQVAHGAAAG